MAWTPSPEIAALRDYGSQFDRPVVVTFSLERDGSRFHITSYGKTKKLCTLAAEFGKQISEAIRDGVISPPEVEPLVPPDPEMVWQRIKKLDHTGAYDVDLRAGDWWEGTGERRRIWHFEMTPDGGHFTVYSSSPSSARLRVPSSSFRRWARTANLIKRTDTDE